MKKINICECSLLDGRLDNCPGGNLPPPVRVRVWFRVSVRIRVGGQFSSGAIVLEPPRIINSVRIRVGGQFSSEAIVLEPCRCYFINTCFFRI